MSRLVCILLTASVVLALTIPCHGQDRAEIKAEHVEDAINRAIEYLSRQQRQDGSFGQFAGLGYSRTSLVTLALLEAGVEPEDPRIQKALRYVKSQEYDRTYELSLQIMLLCAAEPQTNLELIRKLADQLASLQITNGTDNGLWSYPQGVADYSNTQFALLALYEADRAVATYGIESPPSLRDGTVWRRALIGLRAGANPNSGGWAYQVSGGASYGSMTAAGISSMIICLDRLGESGVDIQQGQVNCCGNPISDPDLIRGLQWMGRNFSSTTNPGGGQAERNTWYFYYMYGLERVGRLTAQRFVGRHDWYRAGTRYMISPDVQLPTGEFVAPGTDYRVSNSAMALMFLAKGRRPVLMAQLKYGTQPSDWNDRPSAFGQLARHVESKWKKTLTWQIYESKGVSVNDFRQAPVLFISGRAPLDFNDETIQELVKYVNEGGTLFIERACDNKESGFEESLKNVLGRMFPGQSQLNPVPLDHPVWAQDDPPEPKIYMGLDPKQGSNRNHLFSLRSGCRDAVFYCDIDLSCYWGLARKRLREDIPADIEQRIEEALKVGHNVLSYATGRQLKFKYEIPETVSDDRLTQFADRVAIDIAKMRHDGDWDAAPHALVSIQRELHAETGIPIPLDESQVSLEGEELFKHPILFFHGRSGFSFNDEERKNLRTYVERGGMIFGDAVCASEAFAESFRKEMETIFGNGSFGKIPNEHAIFSDQYGGFSLDLVTRLEPPPPGTQGRVLPSRRQVPPDLEGVFMDNRYAVVFSRYDLSCALESAQALPDCRSYDRADAAKIAINIILYALYE
ncbi:MAG: DUF4159 domain-containing protein [Pirellulales bacterium]|nr:DUF4159 domain-containing protein [Pirellulales bacterium]